MHLTEQFKIVEGASPATDAAGRTADYISLKDAHRVFVVCHVTQGNAATVGLTLYQATAVASTGEKVLAKPLPIWANEDAVSSDALVRQTDDVEFTTSADVAHKIVVFQVDADKLDVSNGFDCLTVKTGASNVANITQVMYYVESRYPQATPPSAITD